ncbi:ankyrin repeat domain-containing protein [Wolbachia endosymbiont (group B) of Camptogramma bilineatum]|uniref:ankyrin repeat domain-containing protein n=1 Tax=Wolbachia endosymbiont (group B) of Camptogramma bilineatum TaxID=2953991 RepID=UPI00222E5D07|nr:ankyrin repeat domain-containing protein [Wolbachia endosymbiont (group B) of Camptogramma bilineatum]
MSSIISKTGGKAPEVFKKFHDVLFDAEGNPTPKLQHILKQNLSMSSISVVLKGSGVHGPERFKKFHGALFDAEGNPTPELQHILDNEMDFSSFCSGISEARTPEAFKAFHDVLFDAEGNPTPELKRILDSGISLSSLSGIINGSGIRAPEAFKKFHDVLFDDQGKRTPELQNILSSKLIISNLLSILAGSGIRAPEVFKKFHDVLFDAEGNPTPKLLSVLSGKVSFSYISSALSHSGAEAVKKFNKFYNALFDIRGNPTPELQHMLDYKIDLSSISNITNGSKERSSEIFKAFHDVLFDAEGNPTPELQHILNSKMDFGNISCVLAQTGGKAPEVFKAFHDVLFDAEGNPTPELQHILDSRINLSSLSGIINGSKVNAPKVFKAFHDVLFDVEGNPTPELQHMLGNKVNFSTVFSMIPARTGEEAPKVFKALHDVLFDVEGNPTPELQHILNSGISLASLSSIIRKSGTKVPETFKAFHDVLFDAEGNPTPELQHTFDTKITFSFLSAVLISSGTRVLETFKAFHDVLFDAEGNPTPELQHILGSRINLSSLSAIIGKAGTKAPEAFKKLHDVLFDAEGNPTPELQHTFDSGIRMTSILCVLNQSGINYARAFKKLHDVLFDAEGNPTPELQHILNSKIDFSSISRALSGSGVRIGEAFKKFHDVLFDNRGKPKPELQHILDKKISFAEVCSVLSKTGVEAAECFKELCGFWFSPQGEKVSDDYIASIFNLEMMGNNSLFNFGKNIAYIYKVLSRWPVEVLNSRNVQYLAGKLIENGKKFSKDFEFREIVSILSGLIRLCKINQELATSSHVTFYANVYRIFVSDLLDQAIKLAPEEHNIEHIINMTYILSALVHNNLVTIKSQLSILIDSLVGCLSNCELDNIYSDKNWLHISSIVTCLDILVNLVDREKETFVDKRFTNNIVNLLSNIDSLQSNISDSSKILLVLSRISRSTREKVETNFLVRAIGKVLDKLQYIHQCSDQDLALEIYSNIGQLSDRLKNLLHLNWFLDHLLSNIPLSKKEKFLKSIGKDGPVEVSKGHHLITDNILIDEDRSEKYTLTQFKEKLKKEGKVKYEEGIENYVRYDHGALDFDYEFNIEKNHSKIMIAKIAYLVERTVYGVFLATNESIAPKTFLGTYVGTGMEDDKEMNQHVLERDSTVSIVSEKGRNWASYMNLVSIGNSNVSCISKRIARHAHLTLSTNREILPGHQLLCDHVQDFSFKLGYTPIYPHYTDNHESPAQRYNREKDFYYGCVIDLDKEITRDLGYHGSKHFVVTKLFKQIYDKHNFQQEYVSGSTVLSLEGLYVPIYAVTFRDKKWCFDRYDRQQQITSLMFSCYLGQEDTIKLLLEKKDDVTRQSLHTGNNALFFTVLSNKTNSGTKKRILSLLINHLERAEQVNGNKKKVISFRSRVLCTTNSSGYNLFDYLINRGEYSLYQELYRKLNPEYQRKVARKFMIDRGVFSMVLTLGEEEYIKIINLLLKNISIKFIKEHFESFERKEINYKKVLERLLVNNRDEKLNNLRKLTNLNKYIKKNIEILLGQGIKEYYLIQAQKSRI